jgi:hypothetical protein
MVKSSADALLTLIDDILDFSKIEAGKLTLDPVPFDVRDAVTDTLRSLSLRAHDKGLELALRVAPDVPETLVGDSGRLRQVLITPADPQPGGRGEAGGATAPDSGGVAAEGVGACAVTGAGPS